MAVYEAGGGYLYIGNGYFSGQPGTASGNYVVGSGGGGPPGTPGPVTYGSGGYPGNIGAYYQRLQHDPLPGTVNNPHYVSYNGVPSRDFWPSPGNGYYTGADGDLV